MTPDQYCQQKAANSGSSFYYSFIFLPTDKRQAITALYAFCREVDDAVDDCTDPHIAESKLQWWRQEVDRIYLGTAEHPVGKALTTSLQHFSLHKEYLNEIIDGMLMDLSINEYQTFTDLNLYCHRVAGVVGLLAAEIFGNTHRDTLKFAETLGLALQLTNIIRDVKEDAMRGRFYLPLEDIQRFSVNKADLNKPITSEAVKALLKFQVQRAEEYYQKAYQLLPKQDRYSQLSSLIMADIYRILLREIEMDDYRVMEHQIKLTPLRKLWIAWKTYRREKKLAKQ
jgi:phytoene synthase